VLAGLMTMAFALTLSLTGATILQLAMSVLGLVGGPVLGVFCLGLFTPYAKSHGALTGLFTVRIRGCSSSFGLSDQISRYFLEQKKNDVPL
jgi:Na+/proline symporter